MSILQMGTLRTRPRRHLGSLVSNQPDCMWAVSTIRGREGRLPSGFPVGRKRQERGQTQLPLLVHRSGCPDRLLQSRPCGVFSPPQQVSLIPHPTPTPGQELGSEPQTWTPAVGAEGNSSRLPCLGMNPGPGHRRASWAVEQARGCPGMGRCGGRWDALEAEGLAPPTGQHPDLHLRGSWLRHGGWAVLRQRVRG